jgi:single-strand DNA-binding protein
MSKLNRYSFIGNLGADAELKTINDNQRAVINFSVAITEKWKDQQGNEQSKTRWIRCALWRKTDQVGIAQYLKKGTSVYVEGIPEARAFVNAAGEAQASLDVAVSSIDLLGSPQGQDQQQAPAAPTAPRGYGQPHPGSYIPQQPPVQQSAPPVDDDLPF